MNTKQFGIIFLASIALLALLGCVSQCNTDTPEKCNKSCSSDADCKFDWSAGCINKSETVEFVKQSGTTPLRIETGCTCINNKCVSCVGEGGTIPVIAEPPECCSGLTLIPPKEQPILGISGYCTAKCGNGTCDEIESELNCPADCEAAAGPEEQVIGPDAYANEQQAFDAIAEEVEAMPELSDAELEALLGE
jgi:hypothetical protein